MPGRRRHFLIPCGLTIIVRVDVYKPRCDVAATGVEHFLRVTKVSAYRNNRVTRDCYICCIGLTASTIDDCATANNQIVSHEFFLIILFRHFAEC